MTSSDTYGIALYGNWSYSWWSFFCSTLAFLFNDFAIFCSTSSHFLFNEFADPNIRTTIGLENCEMTRSSWQETPKVDSDFNAIIITLIIKPVFFFHLWRAEFFLSSLAPFFSILLLFNDFAFIVQRVRRPEHSHHHWNTQGRLRL